MKWLERLRAKTATPTGEALTKLTKVAVAGSVSDPSGGLLLFQYPMILRLSRQGAMGHLLGTCL
jgi:hypothetical protein